MEPRDILWRVLEHLDQIKLLVDDSTSELNPKQHNDIIKALTEVEQLTNTQQNIVNRIRKRYE